MYVNSFLQYLRLEKRYASNTLVAYENDLGQYTNFISKNYKDLSLLDVNHHQIRSWAVHLLREDKIGTKSINRKLSAVKSFYKFLNKRKFTNSNPAKNIIAPKVAKRLPEFVNEKQMQNLLGQLEFVEGFEGVRDQLLIELLYHTGMRRSELIHLKEQDIQFNPSQIRILGKGNKMRIIPFGKRLKDLILRYLDVKKEQFPGTNSSILLLNNKGNIMYPKFVYSTVKKYLSLITTSDFKGPHVLRHTFATHLANQGADLNAIKALLGHESLAATQIYTHNSIEQLKSVYEQAHPKAKT